MTLYPLHEGNSQFGIGELGFGAGVFYLYICIDKEQLEKNLGGDSALAAKALSGLLNAVTKVSPTGKQNSFASRAYAGYVLAEKGDQQPRSLAQAFLKPVRGQDMMNSAVKELEDRRKKFGAVYGACSDQHIALNVEADTVIIAVFSPRSRTDACISALCTRRVPRQANHTYCIHPQLTPNPNHSHPSHVDSSHPPPPAPPTAHYTSIAHSDKTNADHQGEQP